MKKVYIVTGANGHLGNTIIRILDKNKKQVRGLIMPMENGLNSENIRYYHGDIRDSASIECLFEGLEDCEVYLIHTAGVIDITDEVTPLMYDVNVNGTKNIIEACKKHHVKRMVYVSSVHAIPEGEAGSVIREVESFSKDDVVGGYAKTKAEATQLVLDSAKKDIDAVIVHPSGILGPYGDTKNHLLQLVKSYITGKLLACVKGGYDFVDVRDVARGILLALEYGKRANCYILSNRHCDIKDMLNLIRRNFGGKYVAMVPIPLAKAMVPLMISIARRRRERPLYTKYSLYTLTSNDAFSHEKATRELGYKPRDLYTTLEDTVFWIKSRTKPKKKRRKNFSY